MGLFYANYARGKKDSYIEQTWIFEDECHFFHTLKICHGFFTLSMSFLICMFTALVKDPRCTWNSANIIKAARKLPLYVLAESFDLFYFLWGGGVWW